MRRNPPLSHRAWRLAMMTFHRWPIHPGWRHPLRFDSNGCVLCRRAWANVKKMLPPFPDESQIKTREPVLDAEGNVVRRGIVMTATARRQLEEIYAKNPDMADQLEKALDDITRDP